MIIKRHYVDYLLAEVGRHGITALFSGGIGSMVDVIFIKYEEVKPKWWHRKRLYTPKEVYRGYYHETINGTDYDGLSKLLLDVCHLEDIYHKAYGNWYLTSIKNNK